MIPLHSCSAIIYFRAWFHGFFFSLWYFILACTHRLHPLDRQFWYHKISARQFEVHQTKPGFPMKIPCLRRFVKLSRFPSAKHELISQIFFRIILATKYTPKMILVCLRTSLFAALHSGQGIEIMTWTRIFEGKVCAAIFESLSQF